MFKMLGEKIHHMSFKVVFGSFFVILHLRAHECFNSSEMRKGSITVKEGH